MLTPGTPHLAPEGSVDAHTARSLSVWVDYVAEAVRRDERPPTGEVLDLLAVTFECTASRNWFRSDGSFGWDVLGGPPGWPTPDAVAYWRDHRDEHPLLRCSAGSPRPATSVR